MNFLSSLFSFNTLLGIIGIVGGFFMIKESYYMNHHILFLGYFEKKFGPGMGTTAYKFIGLAIMIFSFFVLIGTIDLFDNSSLQSSQTNQAAPQQPGTVIPRRNNSGPNIAQ